MDGLRQIPLYRSTSRPLTILGADRDLMLVLIVLCAALVFTGVSFVTTVIGVTVWTLGLFGLRQLARHDPQLVKVFMSYWFRYRTHRYSAAARLTANGHRPLRETRSRL